MPFRNKKWGMLGTGIHHGQPLPGVEKAFALLEDRGILEPLKKKMRQWESYGDLADKLPSEVPYKTLYETTKQIIANQQTPLLIGGDHSQAFATVSALLESYPDLKIIWVDAHGDINTPSSSLTGNLHGMPLAGLLGIVDKSEFKMPWLQQGLNPKNVALVGIRDLDREEMKIITEKEVLHYSASDVETLGMNSVMADILKTWGQKGPVHLSFDIDGLDSKIVPATGTPVTKGLSLTDGITLIEKTLEYFDLVSCEIVELNPDLAKSEDELNTTLKTVAAILNSICDPKFA